MHMLGACGADNVATGRDVPREDAQVVAKPGGIAAEILATLAGESTCQFWSSRVTVVLLGFLAR